MSYAKGKIYALRTHKGDEVYVGSTVRTLNYRFRDHKNKSNKCCSKSLFERYNDVYIELIELFPCKSRRELDRREGEIILGFGDKAVNKNIAGLTRAESDARWRANNPEKSKESHATYRENNKEKCKESVAKYRAENREKLLESKAKYYEANREKCKESNAKYRAENREKKAESAAKYYAENREEINARTRERYAKNYAENREEINAKQRERRAKKKAELAQSSSASG